MRKNKVYERIYGHKPGYSICGIDDWNIFTQSRTTACCPEKATMEIHDLSGKVIGKCCPKHAKELELLMQAVNGFVTGKFVGKN